MSYSAVGESLHGPIDFIFDYEWVVLNVGIMHNGQGDGWHSQT